MGDRWILTAYSHSWLNGTLTVTTRTNIACHQWLRWTDIPFRVHLRTEMDRGLAKLGEPDYCFVQYNDIEQNEAGDTTEHTFTWLGWFDCRRCWYYFWATISTALSPSNTAIFELHYRDGPVFSIGEYLDPVALFEHVKLEEGAGIILTRDDAKNSLKISAG